MKFETYTKVKFKNTNNGGWLILSPAIDLAVTNDIKFLDGSYVILSLDDAHPNKLKIVSANKLELL